MTKNTAKMEGTLKDTQALVRLRKKEHRLIEQRLHPNMARDLKVPKYKRALMAPSPARKRKAKMPMKGGMNKEQRRSFSSTSSSSESSSSSHSDSSDIDSSSPEEESSTWLITKSEDLNAWKLPKKLAKTFTKSFSLMKISTHTFLRKTQWQTMFIQYPTGWHNGNLPWKQ